VLISSLAAIVFASEGDGSTEVEGDGSPRLLGDIIGNGDNCE
jgi:hypothetical protein